MTPPLATCQCASNELASCGNAITQEDLLCDMCRECRRVPGAVCMAVTLPGEGSSHFGLLGPAALPIPVLVTVPGAVS
jgi:hypothetical protein